jgi:hypothetical protein
MKQKVCQPPKQAVSPPDRLGDLFLKVFGTIEGVELELPSRERHEPMDIE